MEDEDDASLDNYAQPAIHTKVQGSVVRNLRDAVSELQNPKTINLSIKADLNDRDVVLVGTLLLENYTLRTVDLSQNKIEGYGTRSLAKVLESNSTLVAMDLSYNFELKDEGACSLAGSLHVNTSLTELNLTYDHIGDDGAKALAEALTHNSSLVYLILLKNQIGDEGAIALANALEENKVLSQLDLSDNKLTDDCCPSISHMLTVNEGLTDLRLSLNEITQSGANFLVEGLKLNDSITYMSVKRVFNDQFAPFTDKNKHRIVESYNDVLSNNRKGAWRRSKLMIIGEGRAGKTATVHALMGQKFVQDWKSTVGVAIMGAETGPNASAWRPTYSMKTFTDLHAARVGLVNLQKGLQQNKRKTQISAFGSGKSSSPLFSASAPIANDERKSAASPTLPRARRKIGTKLPSSFRGTGRGPRFPPRRSNRDSAAEDQMRETVTTVASISPPKRDTTIEFDDARRTLNGSLIEKEEMKEMEKQLLIEAKSTKDNISLSIWDYGGQAVFHTLHHLFMTRYGTYLLIFDMQMLLKSETRERTIEHMHFWLNTTKLHAPKAPVLVVGTMLDVFSTHKRQTAMSKVNRLLVNEVLGSKYKVTKNRADAYCFFPISNYARIGIGTMRDAIANVTRAQDYVNIEVPLSWMKCLDDITEYKRSHSKSYMRLSEVKEITAVHGVSNGQQVNEMLMLFHELGVVLYFHGTERLRDVVVFDPQWLVNCISKVIRDTDLHKYDYSAFQHVGLMKDMNAMFDYGMYSHDLLQFLWSGTHFQFILDLMQHLLLLSPWNFSESSDQMFLVPSMVGRLHEGIELQPHGRRAVFDFSTLFLPDGVYERLVCLFVQSDANANMLEGGRKGSDKPVDTPILTKHLSMLWLTQEAAVYLQKTDDTIVLWVVKPETSSRALQVVLTMMRKLQNEIFSGGLKYQALVEGKAGTFLKYDRAKREKMKPWFQDRTTDIVQRRKADTLYDIFMQ